MPCSKDIFTKFKFAANKNKKQVRFAEGAPEIITDTLKSGSKVRKKILNLGLQVRKFFKNSEAHHHACLDPSQNRVAQGRTHQIGQGLNFVLLERANFNVVF